MKRFIKKFALLAITLVILDLLIGAVLKYYYFKQKSGLLYRSTYAIDSTRAAVLVFGSSRANHHYVPSVFENKLHATFYNCGRDGCNLLYDLAVISAVLERYKPQHIIIDVMPDEFSRSEEGQLSYLLPYHDNPSINHFIKYNSKFESYKLLSRMYPYNSLLTNIIVGNLSSHKSYSIDDKGYIKLDNVMPFYPKTISQQAKINVNLVRILNDVLITLSRKHIPVTFVISPSYFLFAKENDNVEIIENLCRMYNNVDFFNYENDTAFAAYGLYYDDLHLNYIGANKFSENLSDKLLRIEN